MELDTVPFSIIEIYLKMGGLSTIIFTVAILVISGYVYRWRNPKGRGALPPGTSGFPLIGEALQLVRPSAFLDLIPFLKSRIKWYGPIFRTNIAGINAIISADPEINRFLLRGDGDLMEGWPVDPFTEKILANQFLEKHFRKFVLHHFGVDLVKEKLLSRVEETANQTIWQWSSQESVEVKGGVITVKKLPSPTHGKMMAITLAMQQIFSGDLEIEPFHLSEFFKDFIQGFMSFPLNIPGTTYHKCRQIEKKVKRLINDAVQNRMAAAELEEKSHRGDLLDHLIHDIATHEHINDVLVVDHLFSLLFVITETTSTTLALALKLLNDHPAVVEELQAEHEEILKRREKVDSPLSWSEYKSMTFTSQVIKEVLRLGNNSPGLFRRALKDIPVNGYVIPQGWAILIATSVPPMDSNQFEDPLSFNPSRWKNIEADVSKCFLPFGSGVRQCTGAEYGKAFLVTFLHVMVTKYRFKMVKNGRIVRAPILKFPDGIHFTIAKKCN